MFFKHAGFRNEELGNRQATKSFEVSSMNAAIATASISPLFRGACDVPALTEASKQASKPLFINKGLLLTDRSISGHSSFHTPFSFNRESLCLEMSPHHIFLSAKSGMAGLSRILSVQHTKMEVNSSSKVLNPYVHKHIVF